MRRSWILRSAVALMLMASLVLPTLALAKGAKGGTPADRAQATLTTLQARYDATTARVSAKLARLTAAADKLEAAGTDVSTIRAAVVAVNAKLAIAASEKAKAVELLNAVAGSSDQKAALKTAKVQVASVHTALKATRAELRIAAAAVRAAKGK